MYRLASPTENRVSDGDDGRARRPRSSFGPVTTATPTTTIAPATTSHTSAATSPTTVTTSARPPRHGRSSCTAATIRSGHQSARSVTTPTTPGRSRTAIQPITSCQREDGHGGDVGDDRIDACGREAGDLVGRVHGPGVHRDADGVRLLQHGVRGTISEDAEERVHGAVTPHHGGADGVERGRIHHEQVPGGDVRREGVHAVDGREME